MANHILETRKAIVAALRANAAVTAIVPSARVYSEEAPANAVWPFTLCGLPTEIPSPASCWDASELSVTIHGFARGPGMDAASALGDAVKRALDGLHVVRGELVLDMQHQQTQIIRDTSETSDYHVLVRCLAYVAEARAT